MSTVGTGVIDRKPGQKTIGVEGVRTLQGNKAFLVQKIFSANGTVFIAETVVTAEFAEVLDEEGVGGTGRTQVLVESVQGFEEIADQLNSLNGGPSEGIGKDFHQDVFDKDAVEIELELLLHLHTAVEFFSEEEILLRLEGGDGVSTEVEEGKDIADFFNKFTAAVLAEEDRRGVKSVRPRGHGNLPAAIAVEQLARLGAFLFESEFLHQLQTKSNKIIIM